jgi:hypothetical protein
VQNDFNISLTPPLLLSIDIFFQQYVTVIGHVLLIERVLATVFVSCYENFRKPYFSIAWFIFLVGSIYFLTINLINFICIFLIL